MKCPNCGVEMEKGFFGCESSEWTRPSWFKKKTLLALGGEPLGKFNLTMSYFQGSRCRECRTLVLNY
jgi:hypothetical protein